MKNTNRIANIIAQIIAPIIFIAYYLTSKTVLLLIRFWRVEFKLAILLFFMNCALPVLTNVVYAPKPTYAIYAEPKTEKAQIMAYIIERFGDQAENAFKVLSCENHALNPKARGISPNHTVDVGIFQVNSVHGIPESYLKDWHTNIDVAYQIYKASGWNAWACVTVYHALDK
jgi:hypothetical protein